MIHRYGKIGIQPPSTNFVSYSFQVYLVHLRQLLFLYVLPQMNSKSIINSLVILQSQCSSTLLKFTNFFFYHLLNKFKHRLFQALRIMEGRTKINLLYQMPTWREFEGIVMC